MTRSLWTVLAAVFLMASACSGPGSRTAQGRATDQPEAPAWYGQPSKVPHVLDGYGSGRTLAEASRSALQDISSQVKVQVTGSTGTYQVAIGGRLVEDRLIDSTVVKTGELLRQARRVRVQRIGGTTFAQHRLDLRAESARLAEAVLQKWRGVRPQRITWKGSTALARGVFAAKLADHLVSKAGSGVREVPISLLRQANLWLLSVDGVTIPLDAFKLGRLMRFASSSPLRLRPIPATGLSGRHRFVDGDRLHFEISGAQGGFVSLFNVYPDGRVGLVVQNAPAAATRRVPAEGEFATALARPGEPAEDLYVLLQSTKALPLQRFASIAGRSKLLTGEDKYQLHELLELAGSAQVQHSTALALITVPQQR